MADQLAWLASPLLMRAYLLRPDLLNFVAFGRLLLVALLLEVSELFGALVDLGADGLSQSGS
jgi:hypothetical protein